MAGLTDMKLEYNELMAQYIQERLDDPLNGYSTTSKYVSRVIGVLTRTAEDLHNSDEDAAEALEDAALLARCFAATSLKTPNNDHMRFFLQFVAATQSDMSRFQPPVEEAITAESSVSTAFWDLLKHYILVGRLSDATNLLLSRDTDGDDVAALLDSYPLETPKQSVFMAWRQRVLALCHNLADSRTSEVYRVALLLSGDTDEILRCADNWPEALCGLTLFLDPTFESISLNFSVAYERLGTSTVPTWEEGCRALFEDRVIAALACLKTLDVPTAVVFSEFAHEDNLLQKYDGLPNSGIREELGLEYAKDLLSEQATVQIGLDMLVNINTDAAGLEAEQLLPTVVEKWPSAVEAAVAAAAQLRLADLETSLCKTAAKVYWKTYGDYLRALQFFYRAGDFAMMSQCSWDLFERLLLGEVAGDAETQTVLSDIAFTSELSPIIRDGLAPAAVLRQLLEAIQSDDVAGAVDSMRGLLALPSGRIEYYPLLVSLLSTATPGTLSTSESAMLMRALDTYDRAPLDIREKSRELQEQAGWSGESVADLRKQLAKSLAL